MHSAELKVSPEKPGFSSSDLASDPEDKLISEGEDEDDDRNHKHRKREAHSQSLEGDSIDQGLTRPYRKKNRPIGNGYSYRDGDPQVSETWRNDNSTSDRGFPSRFEKRRSNQASFSKAPLGEASSFWGRGRKPISWGVHDPRLGLVDVSSQAVQPGHVPSALYAGRGFPNVSNTQSTSWSPFGLVPGMPNGSLDSLHPIGFQGALRPSISPPINIGIPIQRCRDFEERGFCLRGDMCPMEHGVNRIVVEDVQSLSQFNLPVALPGSQHLGTSSGQGSLPVNNKKSHAKINAPGMTEDVLGFNGGVPSSDVYDPDQPLWKNDIPETSAAFSALNQSSIADGTKSSLGVECSDQQKIESIEAFNEEPHVRNASGSQSSWGRLKRSSEANKKFDSVGTSSGYHEGDAKSEKALSTNVHDVPLRGQQMNVDGNNPLVKESTLKQYGSDYGRNIRKPSQKALRTLFVHGIPLKDNRKEVLLSHFQKFGEVIDIYIPTHGERAFVQFLKKEEAEAALKSPDAVMGNRFIKVWWANRDNIPEDGFGGSSSVPINSLGVTNPTPSHPFVLAKGKENIHHASGKVGNASSYDHPKPMVCNSPKAPPQRKKLENLELLKEQLRKKQAMLEEKRNEFRRQLDKLEKEAVGSKDVGHVTVTGLTTKKLIGETSPNNPAKAETSKTSPIDDIKTENNTSSLENAVAEKSTSNATVPLQESLKPSVRSQAPSAVNRFKLDNRPTTFRIVSPLPDALAKVAALEEHFSTYGELLSVELEELQQDNANNAPVSSSSSSSNVSARVSFTSRHFAEKAFSHAKTWQGHKLEFAWFPSVNSGKEGGLPGKTSAASGKSPDANVERSAENAAEHIQYQKTVALGSDGDEHMDTPT